MCERGRGRGGSGLVALRRTWLSSDVGCSGQQGDGCTTLTCSRCTALRSEQRRLAGPALALTPLPSSVLLDPPRPALAHGTAHSGRRHTISRGPANAEPRRDHASLCASRVRGRGSPPSLGGRTARSRAQAESASTCGDALEFGALSPLTTFPRPSRPRSISLWNLPSSATSRKAHVKKAVRFCATLPSLPPLPIAADAAHCFELDRPAYYRLAACGTRRARRASSTRPSSRPGRSAQRGAFLSLPLPSFLTAITSTASSPLESTLLLAPHPRSSAAAWASAASPRRLRLVTAPKPRSTPPSAASCSPSCPTWVRAPRRSRTQPRRATPPSQTPSPPSAPSSNLRLPRPPRPAVVSPSRVPPPGLSPLPPSTRRPIHRRRTTTCTAAPPQLRAAAPSPSSPRAIPRPRPPPPPPRRRRPRRPTASSAGRAARRRSSSASTRATARSRRRARAGAGAAARACARASTRRVGRRASARRRACSRRSAGLSGASVRPRPLSPRHGARAFYADAL